LDREQVVQYFHDHSAIDEPNVQSETDRYIVRPAQALAYKIGQLKILELRERAQKALGERFDIRAFHDEVLGGGALPLDVLEQRIDAWIAQPAGPRVTSAPPAPPTQSAIQVSGVLDAGGEVVVAATKSGLTRLGAEKCKTCQRCSTPRGPRPPTPSAPQPSTARAATAPAASTRPLR